MTKEFLDGSLDVKSSIQKKITEVSMTSESVGSSYESSSALSSGDAGVGDDNAAEAFGDAFADSDLDQVKKVTERLKLNPRRPSIVKWMSENQNGGFKRRTAKELARTDPGVDDDRLRTLAVGDRFDSIGDAIQWIRNELIHLQTLDHQLARQLIGLRTEINRLKLHKSCTEHQALLDDVTLELEEQDEISDLCDIIPYQEYSCASPLRGIGITRMNLCARRFSLS